MSRQGSTRWWNSEEGDAQAQVDITATAAARCGRVSNAPSPVGPSES